MGTSDIIKSLGSHCPQKIGEQKPTLEFSDERAYQAFRVLLTIYRGGQFKEWEKVAHVRVNDGK